MRMVVRVLAILLIAGGIVWILQGINVLPGSFMTGQIQWANLSLNEGSDMSG
jgi:hypothetical protein